MLAMSGSVGVACGLLCGVAVPESLTRLSSEKNESMFTRRERGCVSANWTLCSTGGLLVSWEGRRGERGGEALTLVLCCHGCGVMGGFFGLAE